MKILKIVETQHMPFWLSASQAPGTVSTNCVIRPNWTVTMTVPVHVHVRQGRQVMAAMTGDMRAVMCWNIVEHVRMLSNTCNLKKKDRTL